MFLYPENQIWKANLDYVLKYSHLKTAQRRKERLSPNKIKETIRDIGAFLFAPLRGSLTVETAIVLPVFLFVMLAVMQYGNVMETAVKFGTSLSETGKAMATAAYAAKYGGDTEGIPEIAVGALSAVYAQSRVMKQAGDTSNVKSVNMVQSSFLQEGDMIDLVLTYQIRSPVGIVRLPGNFFLQRARVRAWTGRIPSGSNENGEEESAGGDTVYVTATGSVYHEDPDCTHLRLSIQAVEAEQLSALRNNNGAIYHSCDKCGGSSPGSIVYITNEGNRYHSSLDCSGLKRTVRQISREELGDMRSCSKCGKH